MLDRVAACDATLKYLVNVKDGFTGQRSAAPASAITIEEGRGYGHELCLCHYHNGLSACHLGSRAGRRFLTLVSTPPTFWVSFGGSLLSLLDPKLSFLCAFRFVVVEVRRKLHKLGDFLRQRFTRKPLVYRYKSW